ncbi:hypothetical protein E3P77_03945 [Wallemia ichthyophaga]|nr:hypothetical protein E3P77_03945 [Wallemia ichthyophaga]
MSDTNMQLDRDQKGEDSAEAMAIEVGVHLSKRESINSRATDSKRDGDYERVEDQMAFDSKAAKSVEGWVILVTNIHEEASEEDVQDKFADFGHIRNLHLNLDRRSGYVKGYALLEFESYEDAKKAIDHASGTELLEKVVHADFAFSVPPPGFQDGAAKQKQKQNHDRRRSGSPSSK